MPIHSSTAHFFNPTNQTQPGQSKIRANNRNLSRNAKFKLSYCYTNSNSVKQKSWQAPNYLSHDQNRKRADWNKHLQWNQNILNQTVFKKKSLHRLHTASTVIQMELQLRGVNQELLSEPGNSLFVEGVIYGIAHIPSNKVYTGQTIHSAYSRFKRHWHSRKNIGSQKQTSTSINGKTGYTQLHCLGP